MAMNSHLYSITAVTGIIQPSNVLTEDSVIALCAALNTLIQSQDTIHVKTHTDHPKAIKWSSHFAKVCREAKTNEVC